MPAEIATRATGPAAPYADKADTYFSAARPDLVLRLPRNPEAAILEIGCGTGDAGGLALKEGRCGRYMGVELVEAAARVALGRLTEVVIGDVERLELPWAPATFDALILSEVLEHLVDPWAVLARLARLAKPGAIVLASSPNVSHWRVIRELLAGRFDLADKGVLDRTHLRWFTPRTYRAAFEGAGFEVVRIGPVTPLAARTRRLSALTGGRVDHLFMVQICLEALRRGGPS